MVFEDRVLAKIFSPKREEIIGGQRKLLNEYLHNLYSVPALRRVIKSKRVIQATNLALREMKTIIYRVLAGKQRKETA
jgi:hypothetical protein